MINTFALIDAIRAAGFIEGATYADPNGKIEVRLPGLGREDIARVDAAIPAIETAGFEVLGFGVGIKSRHDDLCGATIFVKPLAA